MSRKNLNYTLNMGEWYVADFETSTINTDYYRKYNDTRVILWSIRNYQEPDNVVNGIDIESFFEYLFENGKSKTIFFHNLSWDGGFIIPHLQKIGYTMEYDQLNVRNKRLDIFQSGDRIYYIRIKLLKKINNKVKSVTIYFRDSFQLIPTSIKELGKVFNISKYDNDIDLETYYDVEPVNDIKLMDQQFIDYCNRDTLILWNALHAFYDFFENLDFVKRYNRTHCDNEFKPYMYLTVGAIGMGMFKNIFQPMIKKKIPDFNVNIDDETYNFVKRAFHGGYVQFNKKYQGEPKHVDFGKILDVVSSYPTRCTYALPYGKLLTKKPDGDYVVFIKVKLKNLKIKPQFADVPIYPNDEHYDVDYRYISEYKDIHENVFVYEEWLIIKQWYDFDLINETKYYMKAFPFLNKYMNTLFFYKKKYKDEKNKPFTLVVKLLLNSIYGKLCEKDYFDSYIYSSKEIEKNSVIEFDTHKEYINGTWEIVPSYYGVKYFSKKHSWNSVNTYVCEPLFYKQLNPNKAAAAYITALSRVALFKMIMVVGVINWIYSDTDSIFVANWNKIKHLVEPYLGSELGKWEIECKNAINKHGDIIENVDYFDYIGVNAAKQYVCLVKKNNELYELKSALAGVKMTYLEALESGLDWSVYKHVIKDAVLLKEKLPSGFILKKIDKIIKRGNQ